MGADESSSKAAPDDDGGGWTKQKKGNKRATTQETGGKVRSDVHSDITQAWACSTDSLLQADNVPKTKRAWYAGLQHPCAGSLWRAVCQPGKAMRPLSSSCFFHTCTSGSYSSHPGELAARRVHHVNLSSQQHQRQPFALASKP